MKLAEVCGPMHQWNTFYSCDIQHREKSVVLRSWPMGSYFLRLTTDRQVLFWTQLVREKWMDSEVYMVWAPVLRLLNVKAYVWNALNVNNSYSLTSLLDIFIFHLIYFYGINCTRYHLMKYWTIVNFLYIQRYRTIRAIYRRASVVISYICVAYRLQA